MSQSPPSNAPWMAGCTEAEMERIVSALYRVHRLIPNMSDLHALLTQVMEEGRQVACAEASSLLLYDPGTESLYFEVALGDSGDQDALKREIRLKLGEGIAGMAAQERRLVHVPDANTDPRVFAQADSTSKFVTRNLLAVPMVDQGELVGVIEVLNKVGGASFTEVDTRVLEMFASLAAAAIRNARLIKQNLQSARLAAIGTAVTGVSHYAKNVITGLTTSVELIDASLRMDNRDLLAKSWPVLRRSTRRISLLVQDMLSYSKERQPILRAGQIAMVFDDVEHTYADLFARRSIEVQFCAKHASGPIMIDGEALHHALLNLVHNAADAVPEQQGKVLVSAMHDGDTLRLVIEDNGPGVPDDVAAQIWDPFFSTKGNLGTGLGLAVTRKLIEELGGTIALGTSELGGARFDVCIPSRRVQEIGT